MRKPIVAAGKPYLAAMYLMRSFLVFWRVSATVVIPPKGGTGASFGTIETADPRHAICPAVTP
jgi:hypothetical protein